MVNKEICPKVTYVQATFELLNICSQVLIRNQTYDDECFHFISLITDESNRVKKLTMREY